MNKEFTIEEKAAQMLMFAFHGYEYNHQIDTLIHRLKIGGIAYFSRNIRTIEKAAELNRRIQDEAEIPMFIGLDQEGGSVLRIFDGITPLPGAMALSSADSKKIYEITNAVGKDLSHLGFNMNFAPVADINTNPHNPVINSRSYSDDPNIVSKCVIEAYRGFQDSKILPTAKHFPGHGNTSVDSHIGLPIVNRTADEVKEAELIPFWNAIDDGIDGIMVSHILYSCYDEHYPATLSYNIITGLLKNKLGYKGLICTDSLTMGAVFSRYSIEEILLKGVNAGNDLLIFCGKADLDQQLEIYNTLVSLVKNGQIPTERIEESFEKILRLKQKYCYNRIDISLVNCQTELSESLQNRSITKVFDNKQLLPLKKSEKVLLIFPEIKIVSLIDNEKMQYRTLNEFLKIDEIIINENLENLQTIELIQKNYDKIIIATYNIKEDDYQERVFSLLDKDKTIAISMRSPYDLLYLNGVKAYICIYEATKEAFRSLASALYGHIMFQGKLPVTIKR